MTTFKSILLVGNKEVDYMVFESKDLKSAGIYSEERFENAYPHITKLENANIQIIAQ